MHWLLRARQIGSDHKFVNWNNQVKAIIFCPSCAYCSLTSFYNWKASVIIKNNFTFCGHISISRLQFDSDMLTKFLNFVGHVINPNRWDVMDILHWYPFEANRCNVGMWTLMYLRSDSSLLGEYEMHWHRLLIWTCRNQVPISSCRERSTQSALTPANARSCSPKRGCNNGLCKNDKNWIQIIHEIINLIATCIILSWNDIKICFPIICAKIYIKIR